LGNDRQRAALTQEYEQALTTYKDLKKEISLLEKNLEDISFGFTSLTSAFKHRKNTKLRLKTCGIRSGNWQRRIREQIREEEEAQCEFEAREDAETEEARFHKALEKARDEVAKATGAQLEKLTEQISSFEAKLDEARAKKERAIPRTQLTKSGFVYVISNVGSFGDHVIKIGMTRRLEPMDRVYELGGASVPFPFDLHAMLYSDNAPEIENALHRFFQERRLNTANLSRSRVRSTYRNDRPGGLSHI
jgi:T5orf172 domain